MSGCERPLRKAKLKVLLLVTLSELGGAQHVVYVLARYLRSDYDMTVACAPGGFLVEKLREEQIRVVEIPELVRPLNPIRDLQAFLKLCHWMRRERFDLVHAHSTKAGLLGRLAAGLADVPIVLFTAHGWAFTEGRTYWKRWLLAQAERLAAKATAKIICVSERDRELALQFHVGRPDQLVVIHNGVNPQPFGQADGARARQQWGLEGTLVLTFVGRLATPKDPLILLKAIQNLSESKLILVGYGPLQPRVKRFIRQNGLANRVVLAGERRDIPEILAASDVFVFPSRWEGLPLTIIEAMMAGLPVVASRVGGLPELVEEGVTGFLVPPGDPQGLAKVLQRLLDDEELRRCMGEAGRQRALGNFTLDRMLHETHRVYEEVVGLRFGERCE